MIPTVQFDPATLAIWTTVGTLTEGAARHAEAAIEAAASGRDPRPTISGLPEAHPLRRRTLWIASCIWHEKRHFFDICLTNYGARQFRDLFVLGANAMPLIAEAAHRGEAVYFPVEVYEFKAHREALGIAEPPSNILGIARRAREMKYFAGALRRPVKIDGHTLCLGGQDQLEGLAQASQINAIQYRFGFDEAFAVTSEHTHRLPQVGAYRTIETVAGVLGCTKQTANNLTLVNVGYASALFVTALSGRFFGAGPKPVEDLVAPWPRLARLLDELKPRRGYFNMTDEEAWELVDAAARRLWGRTALEEIEADIVAMEQVGSGEFEPWVRAEGLSDAWADFTNLRRRLLVAAKAEGPASLSPRAFPITWVDRLFPWHIVATPGGDTLRHDATAIFGRDEPQKVVWARLQEAPPDGAVTGFALHNRDAWLRILRRHAPLARLMLNGRRHRLMVPPEVELAIEEIQSKGVTVRFRPYFEWPEDRDQNTRRAEAIALAEWSERSTFTCDLTGEKIAPGDAAVLTPWEFRRSTLLPRYYARVGSKLIAQRALQIDWSDWVVRHDMLLN